MRPIIMGVLNVTPDSFSDGGRYWEPSAAIARGLEMGAEGAEVIDVGGESTRPGAAPVPEEVELQRVVPVIEELSRHIRVSIDTMKSRVAEAAISAGASLVNNVSSSLAPIAASGGAGLIVMHMQGTPRDMQVDPNYDDVVNEVSDYLAHKADTARELGVKEVYIDPGIGFGKTVAHNLALLRAMPRFVASGERVAIGTSRKSFIGRVLAEGGEPLPVTDRLEGSLATAVFAMSCGASLVRVHDVKATADARLLVADVQGRTRSNDYLIGVSS